jgi:hypothetical protein
MPLRRGAAALAVPICLALAGSTAAANEPTKQECVAANETAQDLLRAGRLRDAREQLAMCTAKACPGAVRDDCAERLRAVDRRLPSVVFTPVARRSAAGIDLSAVRVTVDGAGPPRPLDGAALPVDPGEHTFTFSMGDGPPVSLQLAVHEGERLQRDVEFQPPAAAEAPPEHPASPGRPNTTAVIAWSALGAGAAGVVLGSIFGIIAAGKKSSLTELCAGKKCPPSAEAEEDVQALHANGVASDISFTVGALGLAAGGALLLLFPEDRSPAVVPERSALRNVHAWVGIGHAGIAGRFP